jgi:hypothetical protein
MIISTILLVVTIGLFLISLVALRRATRANKIEIGNMQKIIDDNIKLSGQLFKLYSALQENQSLQIKAFEAISKTQKITAADLIELREQVSQALVTIVEQISGTSVSSDTTMKIKDGKFRLN